MLLYKTEIRKEAEIMKFSIDIKDEGLEAFNVMVDFVRELMLSSRAKSRSTLSCSAGEKYPQERAIASASVST